MPGRRPPSGLGEDRAERPAVRGGENQRDVGDERRRGRVEARPEQSRAAIGLRVHGLAPLADRIASGILARFPSVLDVRVRIRKPSAPIARMVEHVGVEVLRKQATAAVVNDGGAEAKRLGALGRPEPVG